MKRFFAVALSLLFVATGAYSQKPKSSSQRGAAAGGKSTPKRVVDASVSRAAGDSSAPVDGAAPPVSGALGAEFAACMDSICVSELYEDKGRCRCSGTIPRIEKVLRNIEKIQAEADKESKSLEVLMNVDNSSAVEDILGAAYSHIDSIEKKSKMLAARRLDSETLVMEGVQLQERALEKCASHLSGLDDDSREKRKKEYSTSVEKDCGAYTTILKEKADAVGNFLTQVKKNRELYDEQQYKKRNQLDPKACYLEYEACANTECGENFRSCEQSHRLQAMLQKCQAVNYGKCEDDKAVVLKDLRKFVAKELEKITLANSCKTAWGHIIGGKCLFKVQDKGGDTIGEKVTTGSQQILCYGSCFLIGPNGEERFLGGHNKASGAKGFFQDFFGMGGRPTGSFGAPPPPPGWGGDGYPLNPELRNAM